jgi:RNA polymerase sigma-B factor
VGQLTYGRVNDRHAGRALTDAANGMSTGIAAARVERHARDLSARRVWETRVAVRYQQETGSRERIVEVLAPLARHLAQRYKLGPEPLEDLEQVAMLGLVKALKRFDPGRGSSFASFAIPTITGELRRHYRDTGWAIHVPRALQERVVKVNQMDRAAGAQLSAHACAQQLGMTPGEVEEARHAAEAMHSRALPPGDVIDTLALRQRGPGAQQAEYDDAEGRVVLGGLTRDIPKRDRRILVMRYFGQLTQEEIGRQVGLSQMQVSRILRRTVERMQDAVAT